MDTKETLKIYHKGDDEKVSEMKALIKDSYFDVLSLNILEDKFTATRLLQLANKLNLGLKNLVDEESNLYKDSIANSNFDEADWVRILTKHPELIRTPIVELNYEAHVISTPRDILKLEKVKQNVNGYDHI